MPQDRRFMLLGSGEFETWTSEVERAAVGGADPRVLVIPTASAPEGDAVFDRWAGMGLEHYAAIGWPAEVLPLRTRKDAEREEVSHALDGAGMLFFSGGNPRYLSATIGGTRFWEAMVAALDRGVVFAGCSAGAMVASQSKEQARERRMGTSWTFGLGLIPHVAFGVHWDRMSKIPGMRWWVTSRMPEHWWFVGIDERTAILGDGVRWKVFGIGEAMVVHGGGRESYPAGQTFETAGHAGAE